MEIADDFLVVGYFSLTSENVRDSRKVAPNGTRFTVIFKNNLTAVIHAWSN